MLRASISARKRFIDYLKTLQYECHSCLSEGTVILRTGLPQHFAAPVNAMIT